MKRIHEAQNVEEIVGITKVLLPEGNNDDNDNKDVTDYINRAIKHAIEIGNKEGKTPPPQVLGCAVTKELMQEFPDLMNVDMMLKCATAIAVHVYKETAEDMHMRALLAQMTKSAVAGFKKWDGCAEHTDNEV